MNDIEQIEQRVRQAQQELEEAQKQLAELREAKKPWEPWVPKKGEKYWLVRSTGHATVFIADKDLCDARHAEFGNCFRTKEEAERYALRIKSMKPTCPVPKMLQEVWMVVPEGGRVMKSSWCDSFTDRVAYTRGLIHSSESDAREWLIAYGGAWTTL